MFVEEEAVSKHVKEYANQNKLTGETGESLSKLNEKETQEMVAHLEEQTYLKVCDICLHVLNKYGIKYTVAGMTSWLKNNGFTYKKPKGRPAKAAVQEQAKFIESYQQLKEKKEKEDPILFVDGVHPTMATKLSYGWIRKGKEKPIATTASRTRMNIVGGINLSAMRITVKEYKTLDSKAMTNYWQELRESYLQVKKIHVVLDQGRYNTSKQTKKEAEKAGIKLHYLPTYSPNLNPIERLWKVMNEQVRNNYFFSTAKESREKIMHFFTDTWKRIASAMTSRINDNFQII